MKSLHQKGFHSNPVTANHNYAQFIAPSGFGLAANG
jgi:hypothetical protein